MSNDNLRTAFGDVPRSRAEAKERATLTPNRWVPSPAVRAWLYGIIAALVPLLVVLGVFSTEIGAHVLNVVAAFLAIGGLALAAKNTPR
ncbi:hypothetical protein [Microbacterium paraoxydans]|uniref:hypothetical protein n=1 Tax=Microbacterium paraoxydans TaxID=199592 RepID=UPI001C2BEAD2|nr:hypothetical protein [Microbacterium paraoxydans]QXE28547.1 hypothetical protein IZR02_08980 [Microbacterium paraoxydans]